MMSDRLYDRRRVLTTLIAAPVALYACRQGPADQEIKIGFAGALTGPSAFIGEEIKRGAEIAINEINSRGGVLDRQLRLIARDDEHTPARTIAQYRELVEREQVVAMLGATNSASMLAVVPLVNDTFRVPVICPATDATAITENAAKAAGRDNYIFRVGMYGTGQANFMVDTVLDKFRYRRVALLTWSGGWGVTGRGELRRRLAERSIQPVADETYDADDADMSAQLLRIRQARAEVILNYGLLVDNVKVAQTRAQLRDRTPYFSAWGISGAAFPNAAGAAAEGVLISTTVTLDGVQPDRRRQFVDAYRRAYSAPLRAPVFAVGAYDAVFMFADAIRRAGSTEGSRIRASLETLSNFDGLVRRFDGPVFSRTKHNSLAESDMILARVTRNELLQVNFDDRGPYLAAPGGAKVRLNPADLSEVS